MKVPISSIELHVNLLTCVARTITKYIGWLYGGLVNLHKVQLRPLKAESDELLHLDLLRFIASVGIVLCHSIEFYWPVGRRTVAHHLGGGLAMFVDIFFVISGFVITYVYQYRIRSGRDYGLFLQRRIGRLFPLHLLTLLVSVAIAVGITATGISMAHPPSLTPACLASNALLLHAALPCAGYAVSGVTWSLSAEMFMYVLFPLFLLASARQAARGFVLAAVSFALVLAWFGPDTLWQSHLTVERALPAFLFGMGLCFGRAQIARIPAPGYTLAVAIILFVAGWPLGLHPLLLLALGYLIPVFAIAADARRTALPWVRRWASLGQLTYPLYMLHGLFIMIIMNAIGDKLLHLGTVPMLVLGGITYLLLFLASVISYQLYETPVRRWIDHLPIFEIKPCQAMCAPVSDDARTEA